MATDPVCGMYVDERSSALSLLRDNRTYHFCSHTCLAEFSAPEAGLARLRRRLLVAWPVAIVVVGLTYLWHPADWMWAALGIATIAQVYCAGPFYQGAWDAVHRRSGNMDLLIAAGTSAAFFYSLLALLLPGRLPADYYFDASTLIIALILTGNYLEHLTRHRAGGALRLLREELPDTATLVRHGTETKIAVVEVHPGDIVRVRPGERVPVDGVVRDGRSSLVEALVTGESLPQEKAPGSPILGGTLNGEGVLDVEATRVGSDTTIEQIASLLSEAELSRIPLQRTADRIAAGFVPLVVVLAVVAALAWGLWTHFSDVPLVVLVFVSVVITACPCAFGIATPAALLVGTGRAAEEGIWFKDRDAIERGGRVTSVLTDKTGTLTRGRPDLVEVWTPTGSDTAEVLRLAAAVERGSEHPLARAVVEASRQRLPSIPVAGAIRAIPGEGVEGDVENHRVTVGWSEKSLSELGPAWTPSLARFRKSGRTFSVVRVDGEPRALLGFEDSVSPGAVAGVAALKRDGISVTMVTGDQPEAAARVATQVGISKVYSGVTPSGKIEILRRLQLGGQVVAFVGDGLNDAPVLAAADLGIAVGTGTDVAREAGGIVLTRADFRAVALALRLCRRTVARVRQNLAWAIGYNLVLLPIAAGALVPVFGFRVYNVLPIAGALAMGLSSTTVLLNSLSLRWVSLSAPVDTRRDNAALPS
ncbi:MAG: heavy metal translocating P-type ATPase [Thermoplasmata archaeon]